MVMDYSIRTPLPLLLPNPNIDYPNTHKDVAKRVYVQLTTIEKKKYQTLIDDTLYKFTCPFDYNYSHIFFDCAIFHLYVNGKGSLGIMSYTWEVLQLLYYFT